MSEGAAPKDTCAVEANAFLGKPNLQAPAKRTELNAVSCQREKKGASGKRDGALCAELLEKTMKNICILASAHKNKVLVQLTMKSTNYI